MKSVEKPRYIRRTIAAVGGAALLASGLFCVENLAVNLLQVPQPHVLGLENFNLGPRSFKTDVELLVPSFFNTLAGGGFLHYAKTNKLF